MEAVVNRNQTRPGLGFVESIKESSRERCQHILDASYKFRKWEREVIATGDATEEEKRRHREESEALLKGVKWMVAISGHPDSFERPFHQKFEVLADQLQNSWDTYYNSPGESEIAEADAVLKKLFPE